MIGDRSVGHTAEMCRPPFDADMARNSRIDDREDDAGNAGVAIAVGGVVAALVIGALYGFIQFVQVML